MKRGVFGAVLLPVLLAAALPATSGPFDGYATFTRNGGMYFQASSASAVQPVDEGTWELWVKLTAPLQTGDCASFLGKGYQASYWIGACDVGGQAVLRSYARGGTSAYTSGTIPVGTWTHVAATTDGTTRRHYVNGVFAGSAPDAGGPTPGSSALRIGSDADWPYAPAAQLDEVRIWTLARSATQIRSTMFAPVTRQPPGLLAVYHLDGDGANAVGAGGTTGVGAVAFGTTNTGTRVLFVPVVLKNQYSSEITFTNRGTTTATVSIQYAATSGGGSGTAASFTLAPGRQRVETDAIDFLSLQGLPIDSTGTRLGTMRVTFTGLSSNDAAAVTVRTATATTNPVGRAGLSYAGVPVERTFASAVHLPALRFGAATVRTNLALQNAGAAGDGSVTLRVTLTNQAGGTFAVLPDVTLPPGGFRQFSSGEMGLAEGFFGGARVEPVGGTARFYAYAVQNDQVNSDGSFILPVDPAGATRSNVMIPSIVEAGSFRTELTVTNTSGAARAAFLGLTCPACGSQTSFAITLAPNAQLFVPDLIGTIRATTTGIPEPFGAATGGLFEGAPGDSTQGLVVTARTSSVVAGQGAFGVAYPAVRAAEGAPYTAWISAARQNATNRTNLAFVNLGDLDGSAVNLHLDVYDGTNGTLAAAIDDPRLNGIPPGGFVQINAFLTAFGLDVANAYVKVTRSVGVNSFVAYGVVNDGASPGERTGDGAYVGMDVPYR